MNYDDAIFENYNALVLVKHWEGDQLHLLDVLQYPECRATLREAIENGFDDSEAYYWVVEREDRNGFYPLPLIFQDGPAHPDVPEAWRLWLRDSILATLDAKA